MNNVVIKSPWIIGKISLQPGIVIQISIVAYEHLLGMPARFCSGLIPAVDLSKRFLSRGFKSMVRVIDPTPIANYCNNWKARSLQFRNVAAGFFEGNGVDFFFDEAEQMNNGAVELLHSLGRELESSRDRKVLDMVERIRSSGRKHGGDFGAKAATLYMAAHPFSWLDMHHPCIWKRSYPSEGYQFVNLMSTSEETFAVIRKFLQEKRPDLCTNNNPLDRFMTICNTPCYIPLPREPLHGDLIERGEEWCSNRYLELQKESIAYSRACKDFEALMLFVNADSPV